MTIGTVVGMIISVLGGAAVSIGVSEYSLWRSKSYSEEQLRRSEEFSTEQYKISIQDQKKLLADQSRQNAREYDQLNSESRQAYIRAAKARDDRLYGTNNVRQITKGGVN